MTKILVMPGKKEEILEVLDKSDALLLGIEDLSVNFTDISFEELEEISNTVKEHDKELFISLNKNMHNKDLSFLETVLKKCDELKINGVFYYDVSVLEIHHRLMLDLPLIWSAEHLATNQYTTNYWASFGINGVFLSNEITKKEILEIKSSTSIACFVQVFGYLPMYVSKRHAIDNYLKHFQIETDSKEFSIWKEDKKYPILERKQGTEIYSSFLLNAIEEYLEYKDNKIEYVFISGFKISLEQLINVVDCFRKVTDENKKELKAEIDTLFSNTGIGFLYKETVYQVKKNEK